MSKGHSPNMSTLLMIEKAIIESEEHPTRMKLYRSLPKRPEYKTFQTALEYLEAHGTIIFNSKRIVYTDSKNNPKLQKLIQSRIKI